MSKLDALVEEIAGSIKDAKGFTKDERFALMLPGVMILVKHAWRVIQKGDIEP